MPIDLPRIIDRDSFVRTTQAPKDTAAVYFYRELDPLNESALAISKDLFARPHMYTNIEDDDIVRLLASYRSRCGSDERILSLDQRQDVYHPIFGSESDSSGSFPKLRDDLIAASTAFSERVFDTGVDMLRERVRTAHRPLRDYLLGLTGNSTDWSARNALDNLSESISFTILRTPGIAKVFGIGTAPLASWPYSEDSNADKLLEEVTGKIDSTTGPLTRQQASNRQRLAARGAEAIAAVIDYTENSDNREDDISSLAILITKCYTWGAAKKALMA